MNHHQQRIHISKLVVGSSGSEPLDLAVRRDTAPFWHKDEGSSGMVRRSISQDLTRSLFLWTPWAMALGIGSQFYLSHFERPSLLVHDLNAYGWPIVGALFACALLLRQFKILRRPLILVAFAILGFFVADLRLGKLKPVPEATPSRTQEATVILERIDLMPPASTGRHRVRLDVRTLEPIRFPDGSQHNRFRLWGWNYPIFQLGKPIQLRFRLNPVPRPTHLDGYNPRWHAYFNGTAAFGHLMGTPRAIALELEAKSENQRNAISWFFDQLRHRVSERISQILPPESEGVAQALITGKRRLIPLETAEVLRETGLAHLLAISGLHIALVFGFVLLIGRLFLPLLIFVSPAHALLGGGRIVAVTLALSAILFYMALAGSPFPTIRAVTMMGLLAFAILWHRQPFSLHALVAAALFILMIWPESLNSPSFLLSFTVVFALVAFAKRAFELSRRSQTKRSLRHENKSLLFNLIFKSAGYLRAVALTSLIATLSSMPVALFFFQQHSWVGILANMVAVPLTTFWLMPVGLIALVLMPFGLDAPFVWLMGQGIEVLLAWAQFCSAYHFWHFWTPPLGVPFLVAYLLGLYTFLVFRSRLRLLALPLFLIAAVAAWWTERPAVLIAHKATHVGVLDENTILEPSRLNRSNFTIDRWQGAFVAPTQSLSRSTRSSFDATCGFEGCLVSIPTGRDKDLRFTLAISNTHSALKRDCQNADYLVTPLRLTERLAEIYGCKGGLQALDKKRLNQAAPASYYIRSPNNLFRQQGLVVRTYETEMGQKPWR